jgi:hypothetical protein
MNPMLRNAVAALSLACSPLAAAADPWSLDQVLYAPAEAGYQPYELVGFGHVVAMEGEWLAVGVRSGRCSSTTVIGTVAMYRLDPLTGEYGYRYQLCGTGEVADMALSNGWLMLGAPHRDGVPGDDMTSGVLDFYRLDASGEQWTLSQTIPGTGHDTIGRSIAMSGGVAVVGDWLYNELRGRVLSWRLNNAGTQWIADATLLPPISVTTPRVARDERFGVSVALDVRGCRAPTCTAPLDALLVQSRSGLHSYERLASGWGSRTLVKPARGTTTGIAALSMNAYVAVAGAQSAANDPEAPCGSTAQIQYSVRVLSRVPGSAALQSRSFACPAELGIPSQAMAPGNTALTGLKSEFLFAMPDIPAARIGTVSSWDLLGNPTRATPTDVVADLDHTTAAWTATGSGSFFNPNTWGDGFGLGLAATADRLAVGAPVKETSWGITLDGYVAIYTR